MCSCWLCEIDEDLEGWRLSTDVVLGGVDAHAWTEDGLHSKVKSGDRQDFIIYV